MRTSRRSFLRSSSASIALPFLESLGLASSALAKASSSHAPKRLIFLGIGYGVTKETWFPDIKTTGYDYELPKGLTPLQRHKKDISIIQNLEHQFIGDGHWGSTFWLTGANRYAIPGQSFHNTISADQVAAEVFGKKTRFTSLQIDGSGKEDGHGKGLSLAWNRQGKPLSAQRNPLELFHRLFSTEKTSIEEREALLKQEKSVLDTVMHDARSLQRKLTQVDRDKLNEYLESVRDIEIRMSKEKEWMHIPKKFPDPIRKAPGADVVGVQAVETIYDLMIAAMQVDATRVFSYRMPVDTFIKDLGSEISAHNMSHYTEGTRRVISEKRDQKHSELLARFIDKLKTTPDLDGSSLFDNVALTFGTNLNSVHNLHNSPTLITGGAAGFKHGRHLVMSDKKTPLNNLWLSTLKGVGINVTSHGDSTGMIQELFTA